MSDAISRARENFRNQERVYKGMVERKKRLEETIRESQRQLDLLNAQLPQQEAFYKNSKAKVDAFGNVETSTRLSKMAQLRAEIEKLGGEKISVPALDDADRRARQAIDESQAAMAAAGIPLDKMG